MASDLDPIRAAGAVLWRPSGKHKVKIAVVHRPRYGDWSLPKGKARFHETRPVTAVREVLEETGFECALGRRLTRVSYPVGNRTKSVQYFAARAGAGDFEPNKEVGCLEWLPVSAARKRLTYEFDQAVLDTFLVHRADVATVLLVRHARAGDRESWNGRDSDRPLDARGLRQAEALATELKPFGPAALHTAPVQRCRMTLAPLAESTGMSLTEEPAFTEDAYRDSPGTARRRLIELADCPSPVAVCSQGGVIPGVVKTLAARGDIKVGKVGTPKGAFWLLSFDGDRLIQADPYPPPEV